MRLWLGSNLIHFATFAFSSTWRSGGFKTSDELNLLPLFDNRFDMYHGNDLNDKFNKLSDSSLEKIWSPLLDPVMTVMNDWSEFISKYLDEEISDAKAVEVSKLFDTTQDEAIHIINYIKNFIVNTGCGRTVRQWSSRYYALMFS